MLADKALAKVSERCKEFRPGCKCTQDDHKGCPVYEEFLVATWIADAAKGSDMCWRWIFEYACVGRKLQAGYALDKARNQEVKL
jgi:hypothetical protein